MINAKVIGAATSTIKHASLAGKRMLIVQPYGSDGETPDGYPLIAVDTCCGAGKGEQVIITSDGPTARDHLNSDTTPVRWTVIGICDA